MWTILDSELSMTLDEGVIGQTYEVSYLDLPDATAHRLELLGMTPGIPVEVLNNKSAGTVIIRLRETRFALGRGISRGIHVSSLGCGNGYAPRQYRNGKATVCVPHLEGEQKGAGER